MTTHTYSPQPVSGGSRPCPHCDRPISTNKHLCAAGAADFMLCETDEQRKAWMTKHIADRQNAKLIAAQSEQAWRDELMEGLTA